MNTTDQIQTPKRLREYGAGNRVTIKRIALTNIAGLPTFPAADKRTDTRYPWFIEAYGNTCCEIDALDPNDLRRIVRAAIKKRSILRSGNTASGSRKRKRSRLRTSSSFGPESAHDDARDRQMTDIAAKRREIARRYARKYPPRPLPDRFIAIARAEIGRLARHRLGGNARRADVECHIIAVLGPDWTTCAWHDLSNRVLRFQITLADRMLLGIRRFNATDVKRDQLREAYAARRRMRQRERKRELRSRYLKMGEAIMQASDLSDQTEGLAFILRMTGKWLDAATLAESVKDFDAWQRVDGTPMNRAVRENKVREYLRVLKAIGDIIEKTVPGKRGGLQKRVVKWLPNRQVAQPDRKSRGSIDKLDTSRISNPVSPHDSYLHAATRMTNQQRVAENAFPSGARSFTALYPSSDTKH
jgi:hypothetical protein